MIIGSVDKQFSKRKEKSNVRKSSLIAYHERNQSVPSISRAHDLPVLDASFSNENSSSSITESGDDFSPNRYHTKSLKKKELGQNKNIMPMKRCPRTRKCD